jgi:hypothetical protein
MYYYDNARNLVNDGNYKYVLDKNGKVLEKIPQQPLWIGSKVTYSKEGKKIKETEFFFDDNTNKIEEAREVHFKYEQKGLVKEKKILQENKKNYLLKYEYE